MFISPSLPIKVFREISYFGIFNSFFPLFDFGEYQVKITVTLYLYLPVFMIISHIEWIL